MARLPDINSLGARPTPNGAQPASGYRTTGNDPRIGALDDVAKSLGDAGSTLQRMEDTDALVSANKTVADAHLKWTEYLESKKQTYDQPGGKNFTPSTISDFDAFAKETLAGISNPRARQYAQENFNSLRSSLGESSIRFEVAARKQWNDSQNNEAFSAREKLLTRDPSAENFSRIAASNDQSIDVDPYTPEAVKLERKSKQKEALALTALNLRVLRDAPGLLKDLKSALNLQSDEPAKPTNKPGAAPVDPDFGKLIAGAGLSAAQADIAQSIYQQESSSGSVDTSMPNYAGAVGPMQVMPKTFKGLQKNGAIPADWDVNDPGHNKQAGLALIKTLGEKYGDDPRKIAAAYYSGEKAIREDGTIADLKDPKNKNAPTTLQYVDQVTTRLSAKDVGANDSGALSLDEVDLSAVQRQRKPSSDPRIDALSPNKLIELYGKAVTMTKQQQAAGKIQFQDRLKDSAARAQAGIPDSTPIRDDEFIRYLGPEQGPIAAREYHGTQNFASDMGKMQSLTIDAAAQLFSGRQPDPNAPGFSGEMTRYQTMQKAWMQIIKQREDDAGAFVLKNTPEVNQAYSAISDANSPEDLRAATYKFASTSLAEQQRLGITNQAILPKAMAESIVENFNKEIGNGDNMATRIDAASRQWGGYWPDVYRQIATGFKGQLPDSFLLIPGAQSAAAKEELVRLDHIKTADLQKQIDAGDLKSIKTGVREGLAPFAESMFSNQTNSDLYTAMQSAIEKMAMSRVAGGSGVSKAVDASVGVFMGQYEFPNESSIQRYAVPKTENVELVTQGLRRVMSSIPKINIGLPPMGDRTGARTETELSAAWKQNVMANPLWATNANETGLKLYTIGNNGQRYPVTTPNGKQIEYTFEALRSMVTELPSYRRPGATDSIDMREVQRAKDEAKLQQRQEDVLRDHSMRLQ